MKIVMETAQLIEITELAQRFVSKNSTLPILQNFYFKTNMDSLIIRATDMEKYIDIEVPCKVILEWSATINAKTFFDVMRVVEEKEIEISTDTKTNISTIKSAKDKFDINGLPPSEYVALPDVPQDNSFVIDAQLFANGIAKVEYAVTEKNFSPVLTGILLKNKNSKLIFAGTDSFRLAEYKILSPLPNEEFSFIIPKIAMTDIQRLCEYGLEHGNEQIQINYSENLIAFQFTVKNMKILATSLLIQGNFPDYDREEIMPTQYNTKILMDKNLCDKAIKKVGILTRDINNFILIENTKDSVIISSGKTDKGTGTTHIPAIVEGENIVFGINGKYITDFIKNIEWEELICKIVDNHKPIIFMDKNDDTYRYVVRPLLNT